MTGKQFEREIRDHARLYFKNPKLKLDDIMEWRSGRGIEPHDGEVMFYIECLGVEVAVKTELDKR